MNNFVYFALEILVEKTIYTEILLIPSIYFFLNIAVS